MNYKRILSIQDISCFGQCSLTVALPIISACGVECSILPSAVLSTHTAGFTGYTVRDLSGDFKAIFDHWKKEGITFDAIYTGYLGSIDQIDLIIDFYNSFSKKPLLIVDPAMGDNGKLYPAFDENYAKAMKRLCDIADIIIPNLTEFKFMYGDILPEDFDSKKTSLVMTGYSKDSNQTGVMVKTSDKLSFYDHEKLKEDRHGTGDIYSSAFVGALMNGKDIYESAKIAADYTLECIRNVQGDKEHFYGVRFELELPKLLEALGK